MHKVEFCKNEIDELQFWKGSDYQILDNIFNDYSNDFLDQKKKSGAAQIKSKVIVVVELIIEGTASKFSVGDTCKTLELQI